MDISYRADKLRENPLDLLYRERTMSQEIIIEFIA